MWQAGLTKLHHHMHDAAEDASRLCFCCDCSACWSSDSCRLDLQKSDCTTIYALPMCMLCWSSNMHTSDLGVYEDSPTGPQKAEGMRRTPGAIDAIAAVGSHHLALLVDDHAAAGLSWKVCPVSIHAPASACGDGNWQAASTQAGQACMRGSLPGHIWQKVQLHQFGNLWCPSAPCKDVLS